ncbi:ATPase [Desulfocucumis palustris]|uniref:ATPase n=1 Tax=Desulfocucumis palustris TaxID=1898651 RepID=A0A2L2XC87_9FIRM|nr:hypothetical protein [Desulfocucumis palustris]GBF31836.1 ATPase [Desulfocucumis palustris]
MAFNLKRLAEVIRTNATVPSQADFLATHTSFKSLRYVMSGLTSQSGRQIDEESFLKQGIFDKRDDHQFIVIQGDNGSGKSHLIRWIKERYISQVDLEKEAVLLIIRDQNTLRGALEQIISANIFPPCIELGDLKKLVEANQHLSKEALRQNIAVQFAVAAQNAPADDVVLEKRYVKKIYPFLTDQTVQDFLSQPGRAIDRIYRRLNPDGTGIRQDDLEPRFLHDDLVVDRKLLDKMKRDEANRNAIRLAEDLFDSEKGPEVREKLAKFLNQHLEFVVQSCTNLRSADLKSVFEQLRMALKQAGKNITLFIEDITSFTGIDRALVEVLVTEHAGSVHNEKFCRLFSVVGITNDYYQNSFPDNLKERVTGRVFIDDATLNSDEELAEMAARYINAISLDAGELENWVKNGAKDEDMPIARDNFNHSWAILPMADGREFSIYPFNVSALANMYNTLPAKAQTPRRFLQDVVSHTLRTYMSSAGGEFPPPAADFEGEFKVPGMKNPNHEDVIKRQAGQHDYRMITLLRLWGDGTAAGREQDGIVTLGSLTEEVFKSFNLPFIEGVMEQGSPATAGGQKHLVPGLQSQIKPVLSGPAPAPQPEPGQHKRLAEFKQIQDELEGWLFKDRKLNSYKNLRDDVIKLLLDYIDWDAEGIPAPIVSAFFTTQRVSIEGQTGIINEGFQVTRSEQSRAALLALAAWRHLGNKSWNFDDSADYLTKLFNWLVTVKDQVVAYLQSPPGEDESAGWDLPRYGVLVHCYVQSFSGNPPSGNSVKAVYHSIFQPPITVELQDNRSSEWRSLQVRLKQNNSVITNSHELLKSYYNRMQGSITSTTDVYFVDAAPLLKTIEEVQQSGWDLAAVDTGPANNKSDMLWHWSLKIISLLQGKVIPAIKAEVSECGVLLQKLEQYTGNQVSGEELKILFAEMASFLTNVLKGANEAYPDTDFKSLTSKTITATKFLKRRNLLQEAVQVSGVEQFLILASHPMQQVVPYLELFKSMDRLLDNKIEKFQKQLAALTNSQGTTGVSAIIQKASECLAKLKDDYMKINQGAES